MRKQRTIVLISLAAIVLYNGLFLRTNQATQLVEIINPLPYRAQFTLEKNKPDTVFQTPIFPQYNEYCYAHHMTCQFIPRQQLYADMLRIGSIQYIGTNVIENNDNKGISTLLNSLTTLSPFRTYPYVFAELVVPLQKTFDTTGKEDVTYKKQSRNDAIALGKKGEYYLCDPYKLSAITGMTHEEFIDNVYQSGHKNTYANPCKTYELPHYLGFNYFYFLGDSEHAAQQYMVSSFHDRAPALTPLMAALVYGRGGEHLKSASLWYERYLSLIRETYIPGQQMQAKSEAQTALYKAIFEVQLQLISEADENTTGCMQSYTCLQQQGAIRASVQKSRYTICEAGKNTQNIRCVLLAEALKAHLITLEGDLTYPLGKEFEFKRSDEYNSWRAQPKG